MLLSSEKPCPAMVEPEEKSSQIRIAQRVFSFPAMIGAFLVLLTVLTVRGRFNDPDLWWHLKVGDIIWNTHTIPTTDLFSFTTNNHTWIPHEWLAEFVIYAAYQVGGYSGLMVWLCVVPSLLFVGTYVLCSLYSGNAKVALLGALMTWLFATVGLAIRPHVIGYLLLVCQLLVVHLGTTRDRRWFFCLPLLFGVWVNCHGSFIFGLGVIAILLLCSFFDFRVGLLVCTKWENRTRNALAMAFVLSLTALFVNPVGLAQVTYPFDVVLNQSTNLAAVAEWQPPRFDDTRDLALIGVGALVLLLALVRMRDLRMDEFLLVGLTFVMALRHSRMMFVFGIMAAPVVCRLLADTWDNYEIVRDRISPNLIMLLVAAGTIIFAFPSPGELQQQVERGNPVKAVEFLRRSGLSGRMLNEYAYGGYLIWAAPEHKVFVDGRTDIFDWTGVLKEYGAWATLKADPTRIFNKYNIDFCLIPRTAPMAQVLPYLPGWKRIYSDDTSAIYTRLKTPKNST
jgi:hypothetical protein